MGTVTTIRKQIFLPGNLSALVEERSEQILSSKQGMNIGIFNVLSVVVGVHFFLILQGKLTDIFTHFHRLSTLFCLKVANIPRKKTSRR